MTITLGDIEEDITNGEQYLDAVARSVERSSGVWWDERGRRTGSLPEWRRMDNAVREAAIGNVRDVT